MFKNGGTLFMCKSFTQKMIPYTKPLCVNKITLLRIKKQLINNIFNKNFSFWKRNHTFAALIGN